MKVPKWRAVLQALQINPYVTNMDIIRIARTTAPHSVIRDIRRRGFNVGDRVPAGCSHKEYFLLEDK